MDTNTRSEEDLSMETREWCEDMNTRQRMVDKILITLKHHLPFSTPEGIVELRRIADRFEKKVYTASTSPNEYLRKISVKMLTMDSTRPIGTLSSSANNGPISNQYVSVDKDNLDWLSKP